MYGFVLFCALSAWGAEAESGWYFELSPEESLWVHRMQEYTRRNTTTSDPCWELAEFFVDRAKVAKARRDAAEQQRLAAKAQREAVQEQPPAAVEPSPAAEDEVSGAVEQSPPAEDAESDTVEQNPPADDEQSGAAEQNATSETQTLTEQEQGWVREERMYAGEVKRWSTEVTRWAGEGERRERRDPTSQIWRASYYRGQAYDLLDQQNLAFDEYTQGLAILATPESFPVGFAGSCVIGPALPRRGEGEAVLRAARANTLLTFAETIGAKIRRIHEAVADRDAHIAELESANRELELKIFDMREIASPEEIQNYQGIVERRSAEIDRLRRLQASSMDEQEILEREQDRLQTHINRAEDEINAARQLASDSQLEQEFHFRDRLNRLRELLQAPAPQNP